MGPLSKWWNVEKNFPIWKNFVKKKLLNLRKTRQQNTMGLLPATLKNTVRKNHRLFNILYFIHGETEAYSIYMASQMSESKQQCALNRN